MEFDTAPQWNKELALARNEIIENWKQFEGTKEEFLEKFKRGQLPDLSLGTQEKIKTLSKTKFNNWLRRHDKDGLSGLLSGHGKPGSRFSAEKKNFIVECIYKNPKIRSVRVFEYFNNRFGSKVSRRTFERFIKCWKEENPQLYAYLVNPSSWRNKFRVSFGRSDERIDHFCQRWEADSTPADVICDDGKRYICPGLIDVFSRKPLVSLAETSKSTAIAALLRRGMITWGIPEELIKDHGKDFSSRHIKAICATFGIKTPFIPPHRPDLKPHIEAFWRTLAYGLFEELPNFIGHSVAERQSIRSREAFAKRFLKRGETVKVSLSPKALQKVINAWIRNKYEQDVHRGIGCRPAERAACTKPVRRVGDERVLDILLAPIGEPTVLKKGIMYKTAWYQAEALIFHIGEKVRIREDLQDVGRIFVFDQKGRFVCEAIDQALTGFTVEDYRKQRKLQNQMIRRANKALSKLAQIPENPMIALLQDRESVPGKVVPLVRQEAVEIPAAKEALKAIEARDEIESRKEPAKEIPDDEGFYYGSDSEIRDYESIMKKLRDGKPITDRERKVKEGFEGSFTDKLLQKAEEGGK